jgi:branched-chain amino acid transport system ATP-binding protein
MTEPILVLDDVHADIAQYHILHGVSFSVPAGGTTVLLGRNGAGKTTTLRTIMGMLKPHLGSIAFEGQEIGGRPTPEIARRGVAYVPEDMGIFSALTVSENLVLAARDGPVDAKRLAWIHEMFPAMARFAELPAGNLSGGQKQMLAISRAIVEPRALILVDEPTKGLAPAIIENLRQAFDELKKETTILLVEQNVRFAQALGDTAVVIDDGRIVHTDTMAGLAADTERQQKLLGLSLEGAH